MGLFLLPALVSSSYLLHSLNSIFEYISNNLIKNCMIHLKTKTLYCVLFELNYNLRKQKRHSL